MKSDRELSNTIRMDTALAWGKDQGATFVSLLMGWFDQEARGLPWREVRDPYRVLLSELMLQQTQVSTVIPYYQKFLEQWPTIEDLAAADEQDVLKAWEGLGYYSRARNLLAAARQVVEQYGGTIPRGENELFTLKGVGEYTAGAIRSIAYSLPSAAVDGNVVRVTARVACIDWEPGELSQRREVRVLIESILPIDRPGDFNEALMDLGATICLPKTPRCGVCPVQSVCGAWASDAVADYPRKKIRQSSPVEVKHGLVIQRGGLFHVNRRSDKGLLGGLYEFDWGELVEYGVDAQIISVTELKPRRHVFSHRVWQLTGQWLLLLPDVDMYKLDETGQWVTSEELMALPFSTALAPWRDQVVDPWVPGTLSGN